MWASNCWIVPMAAVSDSLPLWPLPGTTPRFWPQSFCYKRPYSCTGSSCRRWHCGVDLTGARGGAWVVTTEDCKLIGIERGWTPGTRQVFVRNARTFATYGGLIPGSTKVLGLEAGQRVPAGTRIGKITGSYKMLHFELYDGDEEINRNQRWSIGKPPPSALLNPTNYIQAAAGVPVTRETSPQRHLALRKLGHYAGPIWAPWGEASEQAMRSAQSALGLKSDGKWGPKVEAAIAVALADIPSSVGFWTTQRRLQLAFGALGLVGLGVTLYRRSRRGT